MEIGLAETQQTLVMNNLRGQIRLQTDGQLKTGKDIITAALLGAEEYGFATSALIVLGCVMMRKCHLNTCPRGVATQDAELRKRFVGRYEYLVNFFNFLAEDVREHLAALGYKSLDEIIGRSDLLEFVPANDNEKMKKLDFSKLLFYPKEADKYPTKNVKPQQHRIDDVIDRGLIKDAQVAIGSGLSVSLNREIKNTDRTVGAMLSGEIALKYGYKGLPADTISCTFKGSAGQSFGAFLSKGNYFSFKGMPTITWEKAYRVEK
jgi:glutamate synthase (NADPH/NADH) large chain